MGGSLAAHMGVATACTLRNPVIHPLEAVDRTRAAPLRNLAARCLAEYLVWTCAYPMLRSTN